MQRVGTAQGLRVSGTSQRGGDAVRTKGARALLLGMVNVGQCRAMAWHWAAWRGVACPAVMSRPAMWAGASWHLCTAQRACHALTSAALSKPGMSASSSSSSAQLCETQNMWAVVCVTCCNAKLAHVMQGIGEA